MRRLADSWQIPTDGWENITEERKTGGEKMIPWVSIRVVAVIVMAVGTIVPLVNPESKNLVGLALTGIFFVFSSFAEDGDRLRDSVLIMVISVLWTWSIWLVMVWSGLWTAMAKSPDWETALAFVICILLSMFLVSKVHSRKWTLL